MKTAVKVFVALLCSCFLFLSLASSVLADSGTVPLSDVLVYEPGQKAIIGWDGEYEILILSTDVLASDDSMVLRIIPLPSQPDRIEKGDFDSFVRITELIEEHYPGYSWWRESWTMGAEPEVEVVFHEKIGAHDIWVAKANDADEFVEWAEDFLARNEIEHEISSPELEGLVENYIAEGITFFVFDLIEISSTEKSVEPIVYRFKTDFLYYPIRISSINSGLTGISLFLLTPEPLDFYQLSNSQGVRKSITQVSPYLEVEYYVGGMEITPIYFRLNWEELHSIDPRLGELLGEHASLTALKSHRFIAASDEDVKVAKDVLWPPAQHSLTPEGGEESDVANLIWVWVVVGIFVVGLGRLVYLRHRRSM